MWSLLFLACAAPSPYTQDPVITSEVEDWRDEIIYQLMVDRFADGDQNNNWNVSEDGSALARYQGGDYQGILDHVDYLEALGITTLWISPIVVNVEEDAGVSSYHGYWTQNFEAVNPHFGDLATLRRLVDELHGHGIKVVVDIVVNHVGQLFYYDINRNGQPDITTYYATNGSDTQDIVTEWDPDYDSRGIQGWTSLGESGPAPIEWVTMPELNRLPPEPAVFQNEDWYNRRGRVTDWNDREQVVYGDFPGGLKDLATENPNVRRALIQVFSDWITKLNIDGYRIDTVKHVENDFWTEFAPAIRAHAASIGKERFFLFGEAFDGDDALIGGYTAPDMLDSVAYFSQKYQVFDDVFKYGGPTSKVEALFGQRGSHYGGEAQPGGVGVSPQSLLINFMDNHDVPRFLFEGDEAALKAALVFLLTEDGVPCLYYGTEQGFDGGNDPANREPLWWSDFDQSGELFQHVAALTRLRQAYAPLRRGELDLTWTTDHTGSEEDAGILAFERVDGDSAVLVVINTSAAQASVTAAEGEAMAVSFAPGTELSVVFPEGDDRSFTVAGDGTVEVEAGPQEGLVLVPVGEEIGA